MSEADTSIINAYRKHIEIIERENQRLRLENIELNIELIKLKNKDAVIPIKKHPMMRSYK